MLLLAQKTGQKKDWLNSLIFLLHIKIFFLNFKVIFFKNKVFPLYVRARAKDWTEERLAGFKAAQLVVPQIQQNTTMPQIQQNTKNTIIQSTSNTRIQLG